MPYSGPNNARIRAQTRNANFLHAGHTATWRRWVSADVGVPALGIDASAYYTERLITALMGAALQGDTPRIGERQSVAGMIAEGSIEMVTREKMGRQDEVRWQDDIYRVEAESVFSPLTSTYVTVVKRGQ